MSEWLTITDVARMVEVKPATIRAYRSHRTPKHNPLPPADEMRDNKPLWRPETIAAWIAQRPGQGARVDRYADTLTATR